MSNLTRMGAVDVAREGLCRMIAEGDLHAGDVLPSEADLCTQLGVSRPSLREAMQTLATVGVLETGNGRRPRLTDLSAPHVFSGFAAVVPLLPLDSYLELLGLRELLEGHLAALAAARMDSDGARELLDIAEELSRTPPSPAAQDMDSHFHDAIGGGADDPMSATLSEIIRSRGKDFDIHGAGLDEGVKSSSDQSHLRIARAVIDRDPTCARSLAMEHVRATRYWLQALHPSPHLFRRATDGDRAAEGPS
ncbi:FadR family transcriptional regulator [Schaalia sp. 19OD2882]|uniref:FadR/GntR family transcriptional regulator n=1 Tax=Schaalia sp. 19OD2882 TaxID=2794089 RepID=UPI001C1EC509|nr:FCD domain-containing protein [Schaalia sp. 19OD2882]QWW19369.1 FadR family transcriptional regulator [Schaalia sp. 19OD2882]